jgi:transcriptional regulator with XRE-family HTH domain
MLLTTDKATTIHVFTSRLSELTMPSSLRLDILRDLRERAGLTQADMARICGLHGQQSHQTAGAWERGDIIPNRSRRAKLIGYLWDHLGLGQDPASFENVWELLVEEWQWEPITDQEWAAFTRRPRPGVSMAKATYALDHTPAYLGAVGKQQPLPSMRHIEHTLTMRCDQLRLEEAHSALLVWLLTHLSIFAADQPVWCEVRLHTFDSPIE